MRTRKIRYAQITGIILVSCFSKYMTAFTLTGSSTNATIGIEFSLTCVNSRNIKVIIFKADTGSLCVITGFYPNGTCEFSGEYNTNYTYTCDPSSSTYRMVIPGSHVTESLHKRKFLCGDPFGGVPDGEYVLHVNKGKQPLARYEEKSKNFNAVTLGQKS